MRNDTYLYTDGLDSARRSNQVALWRASHQANIACKKAIEESVRQGLMECTSIRTVLRRCWRSLASNG